MASVAPDRGLFHSGGAHAAADILASLLRPELSPRFLRTVVGAAALTVAYAVSAMTVALALGLPAALVASGVLVDARRARFATTAAARAVLAVPRAIDEIVWALLFVSMFGLSPLAGVLAIGLPYGATVARVVAERLQDVPAEPLAALRSSGASAWQLLLYGRLPLAMADIAGYLFYRLECAIRAAAILSFVGLGGLGFLIIVALDDLAFERVWPPLLALTLLIVVFDAVSARVRGRLAG